MAGGYTQHAWTGPFALVLILASVSLNEGLRQSFVCRDFYWEAVPGKVAREVKK